MIALRRALWGLALAGALVLATQIVLISEAEFAPDHGLWIVLDIVIGGGFVAVGLFAWYRRPDNRVGTLMTATGFAFFLCAFGRTEPAILFTVGVLLSNLFVATAIHLLLAFPSGRIGNSFDRRLVLVTYLVVTVGFLPALMFHDPATHGCAECPANLLLVSDSSGFAQTWYDTLSVVGIALLIAVITRLGGRWRAATPPMRRIITPVFLAGGGLLVTLSLLLVIDLFRREYPEWLFYAALFPLGLVPLLFLGSLARTRMLRGGAVGELVATIGGDAPVGCLRDALARALNDPSLELAYWIPESSRYVDEEGKPVDLASDRAVSKVELEGRPVAALIHDPLLLDEPELIDAVGAAAALALERERLDAELRARIEQLRQSRTRMLAFGLAERRRLERDLHDGAQQRLVSLALDLRMARAALGDDPSRADELLRGADEELAQALEELRELARGIHPAVLSDRGLDPAVATLAGRAPLPVEVSSRLGERLDESVELAAYFVVSEALTNVVKYAEADRANISVGRENGNVVVEVVDDGVGGANPANGSGLRGLADRIASLGGELEVASPRGEGTRVKARIPCE